MLLVSEVLENYLGGATCEVELIITYEVDDDYVERKTIKGLNCLLSEEEWSKEYRRRKEGLRKYLDDKVDYFSVKVKGDNKILEIYIDR